MMPTQNAILAVGTNPQNLKLLTELLASKGYHTQSAVSLEQLDEALLVPGGIALALVDVSGFGRAVWDRCRRLDQRGVPLLVVAPHPSPELRRESLANGARAILVKPLVPRDLLGSIESLLGQYA